MNVSARRPYPVPPGTGAARTELDVLAVIDHLSLGGAEMLLGQFAASAPRAGIRLSVAYLEESDGSPAAEPLRKAGIEPINLNLRGRLRVSHLRGMRRHMRATRPDIVHTHMGSSDLLGGLAARSLRIPTVSTIHSVKQRSVGVAVAKETMFTLGRRCCSSRVIVVSDCARRAYLEHSPELDKRVVRIYNGIDLAAAPGGGAAVRRELGIGADDLLVGMISALRPEKGHDLAIETIATLRRRFPRLRLLIVGRGAHAGDVARLAAPLGDGVVLAGLRTDVAAVLDALDVCLHPSRLDAFPTTLIEALAASVPVLATAVGGIPEIIDDGVTGVLVPSPPCVDDLADALGALLADEPRRRALAIAGRRAYVRRFRAGPWIERTRALYDAVLQETSAQRNGAGMRRPK